MPLQLAFVFHFNQHINAYAEVANRACYRGLLNVLRAHPALKFNLHFSGTLLRSLNWFDPETLDLVRAGLADRQFELLGSTYAQNVPYACDDWDNAQQIGLHRSVLQALFGVEPTVFWNSERCWRQSLVPLLARGGYGVTLIEDHILRAGGLTDPWPIRTRHGQHELTAVYDDTILRERINFAAWFGRRTQLFHYLDGLAARPGAEKFLIAYAEDAEAMGLWPWERGYLPHATWAHLDKLLDEIEDDGAYALVHLSDAQPLEEIETLPDGAAQWMDRALLNPEAPYHEDGYRDWFDFLQRSEKVRHFRKLYAVVRSNLQQVGAARQDPGFPRPAASPADVFYRQAIEVYCSHQYEFGCIGVGGRGYWGWENVRATFLYTRLAEIAEDPQPRQWIEDLNGDGSDEQMLCDGRHLAVFTAYGGRLVGWFDLLEGRQWVGNALAVPSAPYTSGASEHPRITAVPNLWLPETFTADLKPWKALKTKEPKPTKMGNRLPAWLFDREPAELTVYPKPPAPPGTRLPPTAQTGALNDWIAQDGGEPSPADRFYDYRFDAQGISYLNAFMPGLVLEKHVRLRPEGLFIQHHIQNTSGKRRRLVWRMTNELAPDYVEMLDGGGQSLQPALWEDRYPAVENHRTRAAIVLKPSRPWAQLEHRRNLLGLEMGLTFELEIPMRSTETFEVELSVMPGVSSYNLRSNS
jgi:hypothetical protein